MPRCISGRPTRLSKSRALTTHENNEQDRHDCYATHESSCRGQKHDLGSAFYTGCIGRRRTASVIEPAGCSNPAARLVERRSFGHRGTGVCYAPIPFTPGTGNAAEAAPARRNVYGLGGGSTAVVAGGERFYWRFGDRSVCFGPDLAHP